MAFERAYCNSPLVRRRVEPFTGRYPNNNGLLINPWEATDRGAGRVHRGIPHLYGLLEGDWDSWHCGKQHLYTEDAFDKQPESRTTWTHTQEDYVEHLAALGVRQPGGSRFRGIVPEMAQGRYTRARIYSMPHAERYEEGLEHYFDRYFLEGAKRAIREHEGERPLLLNVMKLAPHPPFDVPAPYDGLFAAEDVALPENVGVWSPQQSPLQLYNLTGAGGVRYSRADWQRIWPYYLGLVRLLDDCVTEIVATLKEEGLFDDSIIVFTSDHGEMLGSHRLWQKFCHYEESVRVPMLMRFPEWMGIPSQRVAAPYQHVDFLPTVLDLLGVAAPEGLDGISWAPSLRQGRVVEAALAERPLHLQFDGNGALGNFGRAIVQGRHKLIVDLFKDECFLELYDLEADPQEQANLAFDAGYDQRLAELLDGLRAYMRDSNDAQTIPDDAIAAFRAGYGPYMVDVNGPEYFERAD